MMKSFWIFKNFEFSILIFEFFIIFENFKKSYSWNFFMKISKKVDDRWTSHKKCRKEGIEKIWKFFKKKERNGCEMVDYDSELLSLVSVYWLVCQSVCENKNDKRTYNKRRPHGASITLYDYYAWRLTSS